MLSSPETQPVLTLIQHNIKTKRNLDNLG